VGGWGKSRNMDLTGKFKRLRRESQLKKVRWKESDLWTLKRVCIFMRIFFLCSFKK
jgi:hypothetical protein